MSSGGNLGTKWAKKVHKKTRTDESPGEGGAKMLGDKVIKRQ